VAEGWLIPGLVDAHTHPGATDPGDDFDEDLLREDLHQHVAAGVTLIRSPGLAGDPPAWFGCDEDVPRAVHAGPWIAQHGQFIDGWGQKATPEELPGIAAAQALRTGWVKLIADWGVGDPPLSVEVLRAVVLAVHAAGGRVAVHSQHEAGGVAAVEAKVDSLEHGMHLPDSLLTKMAEQGTALTPTLSVFTSLMPEVAARPDSERKDWLLGGIAGHPNLVAAAAEAGVTLLAGTDRHPMGEVADEITALAEAGVPPDLALGAGSWGARTFLGYPGLVEGAPADVVVYENDPRSTFSELKAPLAVVLRGQLAFRRT